MERDKVIELVKLVVDKDGVPCFRLDENPSAINALGKHVPIWWIEKLTALVEKETLERAAVKLDEESKRGGYGTWECMKPSTFIRNLKDNP